MSKTPKLFKVITVVRGMNSNRENETVGTLSDLIQWFGYTLECGQAYQHEYGNKKINRNPRGIKSFITNINNATNNAAANGYSNKTYYEGEVTPNDKEEYLNK